MQHHSSLTSKREFEATGMSDPGRIRQQNEDAFAVLADQGIFVVADGIGGTEGGQVASEAAAAVVPLKLQRRLDNLRRNAAKTKVETVIRAVLQEVNDALVEKAKEQEGGAGAGTTIVLALTWRGRFLIAHLGDSRAYLGRDGELQQLTEDHSLAAQLVRWGKITESQAEDNPGRSTLLRYLGADEEVEPDFVWITPESGDQVLLCTDGLTNMVEDRGIAEVLAASIGVGESCQRLVERANEAGGKDNITALVIRFKEGGRVQSHGGDLREEIR